MTVGELIEELKKYDSKKEIMISMSNYYWNHQEMGFNASGVEDDRFIGGLNEKKDKILILDTKEKNEIEQEEINRSRPRYRTSVKYDENGKYYFVKELYDKPMEG